jgi:tetratricopeptide (TPR) repeat protein
MKNFILLFFSIVLLSWNNVYSQDDDVDIEEPPPPIEEVGLATVVGDNGYFPDINSPKNKVFGLKYSTVKKLDIFGGDDVQISWARAFMDFIEKGDFKNIKSNFGIDSAKIYAKVKPILENYNWPQEASPGWLRDNTFSAYSKFIRTYYDKYDSDYTYRYQVEINFENDKPNIFFRDSTKVVSIDNVLDNYYSQLETLSKEAVDFDENTPCSPPKTSLSNWYSAYSIANNNEEYDLAVEFLEKCLWGKPLKDDWHNKKFIALLYGKRYNEAYDILLNSEQIKASFNTSLLGYVLYNLGKYDEIVDYFKKNNTKNTDYLFESLVYLNKPLEALNYYENKILPLNNQEKFELYYLLNKTEEKEEVKASEIKEIEVLIKNGRNYREIAQKYYHIEEFTKSVDYHRKSLVVSKDDQNAVLLDLAEALIPAEQYNEAYTITTKLLKDENDNLRDRFIYLYLNVLSGYLSNQDIVGVKKEFDKIVSNPNVLIKDNTWNVRQFVYWYKDSKILTAEQKKYIEKIMNEVKKTLNP